MWGGRGSSSCPRCVLSSPPGGRDRRVLPPAGKQALLGLDGSSPFSAPAPPRPPSIETEDLSEPEFQSSRVPGHPDPGLEISLTDVCQLRGEAHDALHSLIQVRSLGRVRGQRALRGGGGAGVCSRVAGPCAAQQWRTQPLSNAQTGEVPGDQWSPLPHSALQPPLLLLLPPVQQARGEWLSPFPPSRPRPAAPEALPARPDPPDSWFPEAPPWAQLSLSLAQDEGPRDTVDRKVSDLEFSEAELMGEEGV